MLEFEDILKRYCISNEHDIEVVESREIKECRELLNEKIKNYKNAIIDVSNMRKKAEEKQLLLLKKSVADNITKRAHSRAGTDIDEILCDLKANKLIVGESVNKLKDIFNSLEKIKKCHIEKENIIVEEFKKQCKIKSLDNLETEILERYISSDKFRAIMDIYKIDWK